MESTVQLEEQIRFIVEIDKLKTVLRQSLLCDGSRRENTAEHSWHIAVMAATLAEYAEGPVDVSRVLKMLLLHDIVEIDAGDTYAYDPKANTTKEAREQAAAARIFGLLPPKQGTEFRTLWEEFEAQQTPDSHYANALDRLQPLLLNFQSGGKSWMQHCVTRKQVMQRVESIREGAPALWQVVTGILDIAEQNGWLRAQG